ncbi:MAG: Stp1/IreP family PP2C-type Ser/Thr phosphatase [Ruminococcaceae bacterium]|nr:Stp1/IreP family PP2C-type Ser/Thr phosphatase [Oscillospiraceae bacterium]MBQ9914028.1 Stp1/IreP family PP2C-type Ser/Thr phosphatase [Clostridia bacterium]
MKITGKTDIGAVRSKNEDAFDYGVLPDGTVWGIVCDGMGGVHGGKVASAAAIEMVSEKIKKCYNPSMSVTSLENLLLSAITTANVDVFDRGVYDSSLKGMGTTIVAVLIKGNEACIAHVGDSRAYIMDKDSIRQITKDHSLVQEMLDKGQITKEEYENNPIKNIITRAMGVEEGIDIEFDYVCLQEGECMLLCTDGLSGMISDRHIHEIYLSTDFDSLAQKYIDEANSNGGKDNITVVIMEG